MTAEEVTPKTLDLSEIKNSDVKSVRVYLGWLQNHDSLWFSSREINGVSHTYPYIHNTALAYAINREENYLSYNVAPAYVADRLGEFGKKSAYSLPAYPTHQVEYNMESIASIDDLSTNSPAPSRVNTPTIGKVNKIAPYQGWKRTGFFTVLFVWDEKFTPPTVFRLGKSRACVKAFWEEISKPIATFCTERTELSHKLLNPFDVQGDILAGWRAIDMPPHRLIENGVVKNDYVIFHEKHKIHVPNVVLNRIGELDAEN